VDVEFNPGPRAEVYTLKPVFESDVSSARAFAFDFKLDGRTDVPGFDFDCGTSCDATGMGDCSTAHMREGETYSREMRLSIRNL
jgi:hypothetical protein